MLHRIKSTFIPWMDAKAGPHWVKELEQRSVSTQPLRINGLSDRGRTQVPSRRPWRIFIPEIPNAFLLEQFNLSNHFKLLTYLPSDQGCYSESQIPPLVLVLWYNLFNNKIKSLEKAWNVGEKRRSIWILDSIFSTVRFFPANPSNRLLNIRIVMSDHHIGYDSFHWTIVPSVQDLNAISLDPTGGNTLWREVRSLCLGLSLRFH